METSFFSNSRCGWYIPPVVKTIQRECGHLGDKNPQCSPRWVGSNPQCLNAICRFHMTVLVSSGCYNKLNHTLAGLYTTEIDFSELWWLEFQVQGPGWSRSSEGPLAGLQIALFSLCPHMEESRQSSVESLIRALIPLMRAPSL